MAIWFKEYSLEELHALAKETMLSHIGIRYTEIGADYLKGTMPVDHRTIQPAGLLHGGASVVLAETLGSMAACMCIDLEKQYAVGLDINANHLRAKTAGEVTGTATPLHIGRQTQVWSVDIRDEAHKRVCISRLTMAVIPNGGKLQPRTNND